MLGEFQGKGKADLSLSSRLKTNHQCQGEFLSANNHSCHCRNVLSCSVIQSTVALRQKTWRTTHQFTFHFDSFSAMSLHSTKLKVTEDPELFQW